MSPDGRWLSLDARTIKFDQRTLSALYHAGLRAELTRTLGVTWDDPVNRIAEMRGMAADVLTEFSVRTEEVQRRIDDKLEAFQEHFERNPTPRERWRLERDAVTDSRPSKSHGIDALSLHAEWAGRSVALGYEPRAVVAATVSQDIPDRALDAGTEALVVERALESLTESQSSWRPAELVRELAAAVPTDISVSSERLAHWLDEVADRVIAERLVELSRPVPDGVALRRDGRPVTESVADRALTTPEILAQEERLIAWAARRLAAPGHDVAVAVAEDTVPLCGPQLEVAAAAAGTRELVVGAAGTGKTSAVSPAVEALRADGRAVFGVAPSAGAAEVLAVDAGLAADTLDKLLVEHRLDRPPDHRYDLPVGSTVVVDEAAMVSTPSLPSLRIWPTPGAGALRSWGTLCSSPQWGARACSATSSTATGPSSWKTSTASPTNGNAKPAFGCGGAIRTCSTCTTVRAASTGGRDVRWSRPWSRRGGGPGPEERRRP